MSQVKIIPIKPRYVRDDDLAVLESAYPQIPFPVKDTSYVVFPPGTVGGNHVHARSEAYLPLSAGLILYWQENDQIHTRELRPLEVIIMPGGTPHAVKNDAAYTVSLIEYADAPQSKSQPVKLAG